jgi:hypothetical protein
LKGDLRSLDESDNDPSGLIGVSHVPLVEIEKAKATAKKLETEEMGSVEYMECSAKTSSGVHKVFSRIAQLVLHKKKVKNVPEPRDAIAKSGNTPADVKTMRQSSATLRSSANHSNRTASSKEEPSTNRIIINEADLVSLAESEDDFPILDIMESNDMERKEIEKKMKSYKDSETVPLNESFEWEER